MCVDAILHQQCKAVLLPLVKNEAGQALFAGDFWHLLCISDNRNFSFSKWLRFYHQCLCNRLFFILIHMQKL